MFFFAYQRVNVVPTEQDTVFDLNTHIISLLNKNVLFFDHLIIVSFTAFHLKLRNTKIRPTLHGCSPNFIICQGLHDFI